MFLVRRDVKTFRKDERTLRNNATDSSTSLKSFREKNLGLERIESERKAFGGAIFRERDLCLTLPPVI